MLSFNPIHVAVKIKLIGLWNQSIPFLRRPCVHPSTYLEVLIHRFCSSKCREIIIFAHNYLNKQTQTKHLFILIFFIFSLSLELDTSNPLKSILTLIVQTIVSVVLDTFSEQQNGAFECVLVEFLLD